MKVLDSIATLHLSFIVNRHGQRIATHLVEKPSDSTKREKQDSRDYTQQTASAPCDEKDTTETHEGPQSANTSLDITA